MKKIINIFFVIMVIFVLPTSLFAQTLDPYQQLYDVEEQIRKMRKRSSTSKSSSRDSKSSQNSYWESHYERVKQDEQKREKAYIEYHAKQKEAYQKQQIDEQKAQDEVSRQYQIHIAKMQEEFKPVRDKLDASFKKQEQMYKNALAYQPKDGFGTVFFDDRFGSFGEQAREITDIVLDAFGSAMSAALEQMPTHPAVRFALSSMTTSTVNIAKTVNQGKPLNVTTQWRNIAISAGKEVSAPIVGNKLKPFFGSEIGTTMAKIAFDAADDIEQGKNFRDISTNAAIATVSESIGATVHDNGWAFRAGSKAMMKSIISNKKQEQ